MKEKVSRFKGEKPKIGVIVAIRADESMDRRTVLRQGDYDTGRYGTQYGAGVFSPYMELSTKDLWRVNALLELDVNEIYQMYYEAGVPIVKQRIGSPVNDHAGDAVKLYKVLNPSTYSKMVGRLDGVDFVSAYGGVFNNGFKYIKLDQPEPFYSGVLDSPSLTEAINYLELDYMMKDITKSINHEDNTRIRNSKDEPVELGNNIKLKELQEEFIRKQASDKAKRLGDKEKAEYFEKYIPKNKTWYDYAKQLINDAEPMYSKSWKPKVIKSLQHWAKDGSAVNETTVYAMEILSNITDHKFAYDDLIYEKNVHWDVNGYTEITRKPILRLFRYNQDCPENLVRFYINKIIDNWDKGGKEEFAKNKPLYDLCTNGNVLPRVGKGLFHYQDKMVSPKDIRDAVIESREISNKVTEDLDLSDENIKKYLKEVGRVTFHDQVRDSGSWKRIVIACLRGDIKFTYLSFSQSVEEQAIRANAEAAFATTMKEREKKLKELEALKKKLEKEKKEESK